MLLLVVKLPLIGEEIILSLFLVGRSVPPLPLCDARSTANVCGVSGMRGWRRKHPVRPGLDPSQSHSLDGSFPRDRICAYDVIGSVGCERRSDTMRWKDQRCPTRVDGLFVAARQKTGRIPTGSAFTNSSVYD